MAKSSTRAKAQKQKSGQSSTKKASGRKGAKSKHLSREQVVVQYTPYVRSIAGKVKKTISPEIEFDDLIEYGMIGLLEASDRFDPDHGVNFMTFAYYRIRGAIYDGLRGMGWMSRTEYAKARYEEKANEYLSTVEEEHAASPPSGSMEAAGRLQAIVHNLSAIYITSMDASESLQVQDTKSPNQEERMALEEARELVRTTIAKLNDQERQLLELYYYKDKSLQEVGDILGLSKSWTSRLHSRVIEKLERMLDHLNK